MSVLSAVQSAVVRAARAVAGWFARAYRSRPAALIGAIVLLLAIGGGTGWYVASRAGRTTFAAMFTESVGIYPGSDVRMLGIKVGAVDSVTPQGTEVRVRMHLDSGAAAAADTGAVIISPSLVSDRYVQLTAPYGGTGPKLAGGTVIPLSRTATSVEIDQLTNGIVQLTKALGPQGANKNGALADLLNVGAANLKGNGKEFNEAIEKLSQFSTTVSDNRGDLFQTLNNLATFTHTLQSNDASVRGLNTSLSAVAKTLADDRQSFTAALQQLGGALSKVKTFINHNHDLIASDVSKLSTITQALLQERASLNQALQTAPLALQNLINAYDPAHHALVGRGDLNDLSIWNTSTLSDSSDASSSSSSDGPPMLLPSTGATTVGGGQ